MPTHANSILRKRFAWPGRRRGTGWLPFAIALVVAACAPEPPPKQIEMAESWAATTRELAIQRRVGSIGRAYAEQLLDAGRRNVREIATAIDPTTLPPDTRLAVPAALAHLDSLMACTAESVRRGDVVALGLNAAAADALGDTLRALRAKAGGE